MKNELISKKLKKYNTYDLTGEYGIGYTTKGEEFYFDLEDYDKIKDYCWGINNKGYVYARSLNNDNKKVLIHRVILDTEQDIDHKLGNKRDNRKHLLRVTNNSLNHMNRGLQKNNTSGVPGVIWNKRRNKWEARITVNRKQVCLLRTNSFSEAVNVRKQAEEKYFGEWSYDNSRKII